MKTFWVAVALNLLHGLWRGQREGLPGLGWALVGAAGLVLLLRELPTLWRIRGDLRDGHVVLAREGDAEPIELAREGDAEPVELAREGDAGPIELAWEGDTGPIELLPVSGVPWTLGREQPAEWRIIP